MPYLFSNPASVLKIPITLVRMLLALLFSILFYLFSVAANIQHYVIRNHTGNLGSITRQNHTRALCGQENNKLLDAWSASATSRVFFVAIEVQLLDSQAHEISEIALSRWSPGTPGIETVLWVIENDGFDAEEYNTHKISIFPYDTTKIIQADEISMHLADIFQGFRKQFDRVYLVGYKINKTLSLIEKTWELPQDIVTIDTEKVWQAQNQNITEVSFRQCIERIPHLQKYSSSLGNTGNKARLGIQLLQVQLQDVSLTSKIPKLRVTGEASTQRVETSESTSQ